MPQNTFEVRISDSHVIPKNIDYYVPVLVYKTTNIKVGTGNIKSKELGFDYASFTTILNTLEKDDSSSDDKLNKELEYLSKALQAFFWDGDQGIPYVKVFMYKETAGAKNFQKYLLKNLHMFVAMINPYKENFAADDDSLKAYKDDWDNLKHGERFFVFSTNQDSIKNIFNDSKNSKKKNMVFYAKSNDDHLHLKFLSKYLAEAKILHSVNPYGVEISNAVKLIDSQLIEKLKSANINYYTLLNQTGYDGSGGIKEGVDLDGTPIDALFSFSYIKYEMIKELIRIWTLNGRQNSKLSALQSSGEVPTIYEARIEGLLNSFINEKIIVAYRNLKLNISATAEFTILLSVTITYNASFNKVVLNITTDDVQTYIRTGGQFGG